MKEEYIEFKNNTTKPISGAVYFNETTNTIEMVNKDDVVCQVGYIRPKHNWFRRLFRIITNYINT